MVEKKERDPLEEKFEMLARCCMDFKDGEALRALAIDRHRPEQGAWEVSPDEAIKHLEVHFDSQSIGPANTICIDREAIGLALERMWRLRELEADRAQRAALWECPTCAEERGYQRGLAERDARVRELEEENTYLRVTLEAVRVTLVEPRGWQERVYRATDALVARKETP